MNRKELLLSAWDTAYDKEGWYVPLKKILPRISFEAASWKPAQKDMHSVLEIANHLLFYKERFLCRLRERPFKQIARTNDDTFLYNEPTKDIWEVVRSRLDVVQAEIRQTIEQNEEAYLDQSKPKDAVAVQMMDLFMHDAYHTGQIVDLLKLQGKWG
jgi:uncharacterized damage-inducible protein DinB